MPRKKNDDLKSSRNWKLLLYPDNPVHQSVIDLISSGSVEGYNDRLADWIGIKHYRFDSSGYHIVEGEGKVHFHFILGLSSEISNLALSARLGLFKDSGEPDLSFLRPVIGSVSEPILYLTHIKYPEKEQYLESELIGCRKYLDYYRKALLEYQSKELSTRDCVSAVRAWIRSQEGYISSDRFADFLLSSPYFKVRNDRLVLSCLYEHNSKVDTIIQQQQTELIQSGYRRLREIENRKNVTGLLCSAPSDCDSLFVSASDLDDREQFGLLGEPIF